jgi:hypothetical protein
MISTCASQQPCSMSLASQRATDGSLAAVTAASLAAHLACGDGLGRVAGAEPLDGLDLRGVRHEIRLAWASKDSKP